MKISDRTVYTLHMYTYVCINVDQGTKETYTKRPSNSMSLTAFENRVQAPYHSNAYPSGYFPSIYRNSWSSDQNTTYLQYLKQGGTWRLGESPSPTKMTIQGGPLPVINGVITPISRVITPVTHLLLFIYYPCSPGVNFVKLTGRSFREFERWRRANLSNLKGKKYQYIVPTRINMTIWVFPKIGVPRNRWFMMEIPIKMDDSGVPLFLETPWYIHKYGEIRRYQDTLISHSPVFAPIPEWPCPTECHHPCWRHSALQPTCPATKPTMKIAEIHILTSNITSEKPT